MSDEEECIHGLGPVAACTICNGREKREKAERDRIDAVIHARFASTLACGHDAEEGDTIHHTADGRWICTACRERSGQ